MTSPVSMATTTERLVQKNKEINKLLEDLIQDNID